MFVGEAEELMVTVVVVVVAELDTAVGEMELAEVGEIDGPLKGDDADKDDEALEARWPSVALLAPI